MPQRFRRLLPSFASLLTFVVPVLVGKLAIVIDDFGYRPHTESQVLAMPSTISIAVLSSAPRARKMVIKAHNNGHEVLIYLLMAPLNKQSLEKDTLHPEMNSEEIGRIIHDVISKVPSAVGLNNYIDNAMTFSLFDMQKVMWVLEHYDLYFPSSMTTGNSQTMRAALGTGVKVIKREIFLDDAQNETDIRHQLNRAVEFARHNGSTIAIGHPHPSTICVLQQMPYGPPADVALVRPNSLLNEPQVGISRPNLAPPKNDTPDEPCSPLYEVRLYKPKQPLESVYVGRFFSMLDENITQSTLVQCTHLQWQDWQ